MQYFKHLILLTFSLIIFSCGSDTSSSDSSGIERPHTPFVFRSVLDKNPRMITFALTDEVWAAYSTNTCGLYKAWQGNVNFEGTVWTDTHGPQPTTIGNAYMENDVKDIWKLTNAKGADMKATINYKGHRYVGDGAEMMYELSAVGLDNPIQITEHPEASITDSNQPGFERLFTTKNVPEGFTVHFTFNTNSIIMEGNIDTDGTLTVNNKKEVLHGKINALELNGTLALNSNASTKFNTTFLANPLIINPLNLGLEEEEAEEGEVLHPGARLIAKSDCKTCHNKKVKTIGPAYLSVAKKYRTTADNIKLLASKVKGGGTGIWGNQIMNAHPDVSDADLESMVSYVLSLDAADEARAGVAPEIAQGKTSFSPVNDLKSSDLIPGCVTAIYPWKNLGNKIPKVSSSNKASMAGVMANFDNVGGSDFANLENDFVLIANGYLDITKSQKYAFRTWSDDGSVLYINDEKFVDNDGMHGVEYKENMAYLEKGIYKFRLEFMQGSGGRFLSLNWKPEDSDLWAIVPRSAIGHMKVQQSIIGDKTLPMANLIKIPGDKSALEGVHPAFTLTQARPDDFEPKVGGIDFMSDGKMVVSTWDPNGSVYVVENHASGDPSKMTAKLIAHGLAEPLGLKVVDDRIFVMQKQEITELVDTDKDGVTDEYRTLCKDWTVSANFHEFGFGLEEKDGYLYAALATAIEPGGASAVQVANRGSVLKVNIETGEREFIAHGLRTPNGVGLGYGGSIYIADNQGDWLPASKIVEVTDGAFFGSRSVDFEGTAGLKEKPPVVWLPQDEIGNSPSTPLSLNVGPYKNQMIHGEVTNGGVKRVFVEEVEGVKQGALFRFTQGMEAGVNRIRWSPDGALYIGGIGAPGNWQANQGLNWFGLQRLEYNGKTAFEMLAVRVKSNGMEIEFTEPLQEGDGWQPESYEVSQWYYKPTADYGGPKLDERDLKVKSATVSEDRKKVFIELDGMKEGHVVYIRLRNKFISSTGQSLWSPECWYTLNKISKNNPGIVKAAPFTIANNTLTPVEKAQGWELLFDGKKIDHFRNFKKQTVGTGWIVDNGTIHLNAQPRSDGSWQAEDGGDLITDKAYENFDLKLEWKIGNCGNSGIIFNAVEDDKYDHVWQTGPEMQILDNSCHPDTKYETHRAGDLYDMITTKYITVNPAGQWNQIRIVSNKGKVKFYQNGYEVVNFEMHNEKWMDMIANSKFNGEKDPDMIDFGKAKKGHIALQDHGDKVWYRNIKIKVL
ncbi:MAG: cytochrome c [Saprospiraceae bacterium]|jgi:cytochrome c